MPADHLTSTEKNDGNHPSSSIASAPFDDPNADVVFRTSDGIDFYVYKIVLGLASPFFKDMFSLTQPPGTNPKNTPILILETGKTFDNLLRFCYPISDPIIQDLESLEILAKAAMKYEMKECTELCRARLKDFVSTAGPLAVFAVACRLRWEDQARFAAQSWKSSNHALQTRSTSGFASTLAGLLYTSDISKLPAAVYFRLIYFSTRRPAILDAGRPPPYFLTEGNPTWLENSWWSMSIPKLRSCSRPFSPTLASDDANIILRSSDGKEFLYHTLLLRLASVPERFYLPAPREEAVADGESGTNLPVVHVRMTGRVLEDLLRILYPSSQWEIENPRRLLALLQAAVEYEITSVVETLRKKTGQLLTEYPLAVYLIAAQHGWKGELQDAAYFLLGQLATDERYDDVLEDVPAEIYHPLLRFYHAGRVAVTEAVRAFASGRDVGWQTVSCSRQTGIFLALEEQTISRHQDAWTGDRPILFKADSNLKKTLSQNLKQLLLDLGLPRDK